MISASNWPKVALGDHVDLITGYPFKSSKFRDGPPGVRLLKGADVGQGDITWSGGKWWPLEEIKGLEGYSLEVGDVILAMDRPWVSAGLKYAWIAPNDLPALLVQRVARMRGRNGLLTDFLRYLVASKAFESYIAPIVTGVNVPHISASQIEAFEFLLPTVDEQRRIVSILRPYDDLIENNLRRIRILEDMARAIYREWFVDLNYPGHEDLGGHRDFHGWGSQSLSEIAVVNASSIKPASAPPVIKYIDIASVSQGHVDEIRETPFGDAPGRARRRVTDGDTIWATVRPNLRAYAYVGRPDENLIVSTGFAVLTPATVPASFLYYLTTTDEFTGYLINRTRGAAYPAVSGKDFEEAPVVVPPRDLLDKFDQVVAPMLSLGQNLRLTNRNLRETRNLFLPKLISGEIDVSELDLDASWLAA